jgi:hypothetical protein
MHDTHFVKTFALLAVHTVYRKNSELMPDEKLLEHQQEQLTIVKQAIAESKQSTSRFTLKLMIL